MIYNTLKEIYVEIMQDVYDEYGLTIDMGSIEYIIDDYFKSIKKFLTRGHAARDERIIENFKIPYLGVIKFNRGRLKRVVKGGKLPTLEEKKAKDDDYKYIASHGWHYLAWFKDKGFLFINGIDKASYFLDEGLEDRFQAASRFREIVENDNDVRWNKNPEFIPTVPITGEIYKRGINGYYLGSYSNVVEAGNAEFIDSIDLMDCVMHNYNADKTSYGKHKKVKGYYWFKADGNKDRITVRARGEPRNVKFSALDIDTGEVVYEDIGNSNETIWFLKKLLGRKKMLKTSVLYRAVRKNMVAYGFKWKLRQC